MAERTDPIPLVDLLQAANVGSPGQLVDALADRGDAVVVDRLGRLAVPLPVAERLWAEQAEREAVAMEAAARAEDERLARLKAYNEQREADRLRRLREQEIRERIQRVEQVTGLPFWRVESEVTRSRTHGTSSGMMLHQKAAEDAKPVGLAEVEEHVRATYGDQVLAERGNA